MMNQFIFFSCLVVFLGLIATGEGFAVGGRYARYSSFVWSSKDTTILLRPNPQHNPVASDAAEYNLGYCDDINAEPYQISIARTRATSTSGQLEDAKLVLCAPNGNGNPMFPMTFQKNDFEPYSLAATGKLDLRDNGASGFRTTPYQWKWKLWCGSNSPSDPECLQDASGETQQGGWFDKNVHELCEDFAGPEYRAAHVAELPLHFSSSNFGSNFLSLTLERDDTNATNNAIMLNTKVYAQGNVFPTYVGPSGLFMVSGISGDLDDVVSGEPVYPRTIYNDLRLDPSGDFACTHRLAPLQILGRPFGLTQINGTYYAQADDTLAARQSLFFGNLDSTILIDINDARVDQVLYPDDITPAEADEICAQSLGDGYRQATLAEFHSFVKSGWDINVGPTTFGNEVCRFNNVIVRDAVRAVLPVSQTTFRNNELTDPIGNGPVSIIQAHDAEAQCGEYFSPTAVPPTRETYGSIACFRGSL